MKNKRNTRRGRAKRWTRSTICCSRVLRRLRGTSIMVWCRHGGGEWSVFGSKFGADFATRRDAMRAAEHLARQAKCR